MATKLRPPINRAMRSLDRSFFNLTLPISAARVLQNQYISNCRSQLMRSKDLVNLERLDPIDRDPDPSLAQAGRKCLLLRPDLMYNDSTTWSDTIQDLIKSEKINIVPYTLNLKYDYWTYHEIMSSILPEDSTEELPSGFQLVGHVAHLNLREQYLPYKDLIAIVLLDKNPGVRTVINKIDTVGEESEYRTFSYEVLAGMDDMDVTLREQECTFKFNYAKVYWNSRLSTEHERLVHEFREGEAVCDVMAGIGPFALPAGKKKVFVWANDLNPESFKALEDGIKRNKVGDFVRPFNQNGRQFIREASCKLYQDDRSVTLPSKLSRSQKAASADIKTTSQIITQPKYFSHFVMNLPASALTFLPSFIGLYSQAGIPRNEPLPKIHVYCFSTKSDDNKAESIEICKEISSLLGFEFKPGDGKTEGEVAIHDVRDVAPKKRMFCASFQLPMEVAFRDS